MPFDRLPGRITHFPPLYTYHPLPPRPVTPWADILVPAVDKIAQAAIYQSPYMRQMRDASMSQATLQRAQAAQQMELLPREQALREKQMGMQEQFYNNFGGGGGGNNLPAGYVMTLKGPVFDPAKYNTMLKIRQTTAEAGDASNYGVQAEQFRKQHGITGANPTDDDEDFWTKYHATLSRAKGDDSKIGYNEDGDPYISDQNE